jgi:ABC-type branched-subunit amino acid transport system substrate-binding protein
VGVGLTGVLLIIAALLAPTATAAGQPAPGVTDKTIKVAMLDGDLKQLITLGFAVDAGDPGEQAHALIDDINERGGINGRKLVLTRHQSTILDSASGQAACIAATEDDKVFAVLEPNAVNANVIPCVTQQHHTPLIAQGASQEDIDKVHGLLFSVASTGSVEARHNVEALAKAGYLKGKKIGIIAGSDAAARDAVANGFKPALEAAKLKLTDEQVISCDTSGGSCSGYPTAVQSFKRKGVDLVLSTLGPLAYPAFVAEANQQDHHPLYTASGLGAMTTDVVAKQQAKNGDAFDGAIGTLGAGQAAMISDAKPPAFNEKCAKIYAAHGGPRLTKAKTRDQYGGLGVVCSMVRVLERGLRGAGKNPTPQSFSKAVQDLGEVDLNGGAIGSFRPGKFYANDSVALVKWSKACVCWQVVSPAVTTTTGAAG